MSKEKRKGPEDIKDTNFTGHGYNIDFQNGPVKEFGVNGCQVEDLLKVSMNRLVFLNKKFPCMENDYAISSLSGVLAWLNQRTKSRVAQGVEGKNLAHTS